MLGFQVAYPWKILLFWHPRFVLSTARLSCRAVSLISGVIYLQLIEESLQNRSILLVDDYDLVRQVGVLMLQELGFTNIFEAANGLEAVEILESNSVDLIIADWKMPKMDGLELLDYVRSTRHTRNIGFIMVSGEISGAAMMDALDGKANSYMAKPFTFQALAEEIQEALSWSKRLESTGP